MTKDVKVMLRRQRMHRNRINALHDPQPGFEDLVFVSKNNCPIHESNVRSSLNYYTGKINGIHHQRIGYHRILKMDFTLIQMPGDIRQRYGEVIADVTEQLKIII